MTAPRKLWPRIWPGAAFLLALLVLWEVSARMVASPNYPGVLAVLAALRGSWTTVWREMGVTLLRAAGGLLLALATMLPLGIFIGRVRAVGDFVEPVFDLLRPLPPLAIVPVAMLFAGVGSAAKVMVVFYSVSFPILLSAVDAVRCAHPMLANVARSLRMSRRETMFEIDLPAALPQIAVGIRIAVALALLVSVSAEMLLSTNGIGMIVMRAQEQFRIAEGLAALVVIAVTALVINGIVARIERNVLGWHLGRQAAVAAV
jgi:ABC-type nitrate/sulfonate/bicarbonate transport system permease component